MTATMTKGELQLELELRVMGQSVDPNPISSLLADSFRSTIDRFERTPKWAKRLMSMDLDAVAFVAVCAILDNVSEGGGVAQSHGVISQIAHRYSFLCDYDREARLQLGWETMHACRQCGLIRLMTTQGSDPTTLVMLSKDFKKLLDEWDLWGLCGMNRRPMVVPPIPHTLEEAGGYLTAKLRKGIAHGKWANVKGQPVIDAMNNIQSVPFVINERVLEVAEHLLLPYMEVGETNPYAHDTCLRVARELVGHDLWNPAYIDHRGRVLRQADLLSEQGNDLSKGLLLFARKQKITKRGMYWMSVHTANVCSGLPVASSMKLDKMPFDERVLWVNENLETLLRIAQDPIGMKDAYWDGFGSKVQTFQALAACCELKDIAETGYTSLPVRLDCTTNNYQHFAAALKDSDMALKTNLLECDEPHDFHTDVADENMRAWEEGERDHEYMDTFLDNKETLCARNVAKNPTLVIGYGGKAKGIANRFMGKKTWHNFGTEEEPKWRTIANPEVPLAKIGLDEGEHYKAAFALAQDYEKSLYAVAPAALKVTEFLRECAKVANKNDEAVTWMSPSGVVVVNHPTSMIEFNLTASSVWDDQTCTQLKYTVYGNELNKRKALTAVPPQFIHSMDASHLHYSVLAMFKRSIQDVVVIHDCYGCNANDVDAMRDCVINGFADLYSFSALSALAEQYDVDLPDMGDLVIEDIRKATYMLS